MPAHRAALGVAVLATVALIEGCGSNGACPEAVQAAVAGAVGAASSRSEVQSRAPTKVTCVYEATASRGGRPEAISVTVDSGPRAYTGFTTEIAHLVQFQVAGEVPVDVAGVGSNAAWLPGTRRLLAATAKRFVTVTVLSRGSGAVGDLGAAKQVARAALR